jgi:cytoskeletal protein CcmA (bactofilin family)
VEGDIRAKTLLIGEPANIKGEVVAETIEVFGSINGQIKATQVSLAKTAHMVGDILHENLSIEKGAFLEGHCKRMPDKKEASERISLVHDNGTSPSAPVDKTPPAPTKGGDPDKRANSN